ncbi:MAG: phospholipid carrier-dependent glycosyltransferase [Desulfobulbus sp.]|nr:phospholipid carrier-dependent glycosyltransferase [Desulfobulbus sp.]
MNDLNMPQTRQRTVVYVLLLLSFYVLAYLVPLGARDLFVPDETRYAEVPREMIASGNWAVPHLDGVRYFEKPALGYWVHAGSLMLFGENNFAVRFPSALAVGLSALLVFLIGKKIRWSQEEQQPPFAPIAAALVFLSCFEVFGVGNTAVLDNLFSFFLTACIVFFYWATEQTPGSSREKMWLILAGLLCGLAFLTKGFLALAVPILALVPYLLWQRRFIDILRMSWLPILVAVIVALPWALRVHLKEPDFWNYFFWNEHIRRFASSNAQHKESIWFFLLAAPGLVFPWTFLIPAAGSGIKQLWREQPECSNLLKFCLCWLFVPFLFFSLSNGKLLTYILPCFPPFALLMGLGLLQLLRNNGQSRLFRAGLVVNGVLFTLLLIAFVALQIFGFRGFVPYSQSWKVIMIVNGLLFFLLFCFWSYQGKSAPVKITFAGLALFFIYFLAHYTLPDRTVEVKCPGPLLERHKSFIAPDDVVISDDDSIRAVCWYLQRNNVYNLGSSGELGYGFGYPDGASRLIDLKAAGELIAQHRGKTVLFARVRAYARWRDGLPPPLSQDQNGEKGYVFLRF